MSEGRFWLSFWTLVGSTVVGVAWAVAWGMVSYHRAYLDAGMVPMRVPMNYETQWVKQPTVENP